MPKGNVHSGDSDLVHGRHVGRGRPALFRHDGKGPDRAAAQEGQRLRGLGAKEIDLPRHQILHHRRAAAVGDELEPGAGLLLKIEQADMRRTAGPHGCSGGLAGIFLEPGDQFPRVLRQRVFADNHQRCGADPRHRLQFQQSIVNGGIHRASPDVTRPIADAQRVAVGRRLRRAGDADAGPGAGHGLDDHRLTERDAHAFAQDPGERVGRPAGGERHDDRDGMRRVDLRVGAGDAPDCDGNRRGDRNHLHGRPRLFASRSFAANDDTRRARGKANYAVTPM